MRGAVYLMGIVIYVTVRSSSRPSYDIGGVYDLHPSVSAQRRSCVGARSKPPHLHTCFASKISKFAKTLKCKYLIIRIKYCKNTD